MSDADRAVPSGAAPRRFAALLRDAGVAARGAQRRAAQHGAADAACEAACDIALDASDAELLMAYLERPEWLRVSVRSLLDPEDAAQSLRSVLRAGLQEALEAALEAECAGPGAQPSPPGLAH